MLGLPGVGGAPSLAGSSSASAQGGKVGDFNFSPKAGSALQLAIIAAALVAAVILLKR